MTRATNGTWLLLALALTAGASCGDDTGALPDAATGSIRDAAAPADAAQVGALDTDVAVDMPAMGGVDTGAGIDAGAGMGYDAGDGMAYDAGDGVVYDVVVTFREPMTQPNDTIFTGTFVFDPMGKTVSGLSGLLTQSMTKVNGVYGGPMTTVALTNQLSAVPVTLDGAAGLLVTSFALPTTDTFTGGGFAPGGTQYYGLQEGTPNNHNAYVMIFVNAADPAAPPTQAQIDMLAYADCTTGGMMMSSCMTGTSVNGYGKKGTMMGYPLSQAISKR